MKKYVLLVCAAFLAGWLVNGWRLGNDIAQIEKDHAEAIAAAENLARMKLQEQIEQQEIIINDALKQKESALLAAKRANDVSKQLQDRLQASGNTCSTSTTRSETTRSPCELCSELFARADDVAGELAEYADRSRIAGIACQKSYDSIRDKP